MNSKLDKLSFEDFQQSMMDKGDNVTPILHNRELIERAVQERYSLKSIYTYMKSKSLYSGNYNSFYGVCYRYIFKKRELKISKTTMCFWIKIVTSFWCDGRRKRWERYI